MQKYKYTTADTFSINLKGTQSLYNPTASGIARMILTRFLYAKDEVELSLLTALLKKEDLKIIYYWAYELYYSGFENELFDLLWKIYLDFYYVHQPYFLSYFKKKYDLWKSDKNANNAAYILRNMYNLKADGGVFLIRQRFASELSPTVLYKCNKSVLGDYDKQYHNLLLALERKHFENIWFHLKSLLEKGQDLKEISAVVTSFLHLKVDIDDDCVSIHYLLAVIYKALFVDDDVATLAKQPFVKRLDQKNTHMYVVPKQEHLDEMLRLEKELIPLTPKGGMQTYNTLLFKRMVAIDDTIGAFALARWQYEDLRREHWFHWEYYAMGSPVWLARLLKYGGSVNHDLKKIEFANEQNQDSFYELYAYELDELPQEVQLMSMKPVLKMNGSTWIKYVFGLDDGEDKDDGEDEDDGEDKDDLWQWKY